MSEFFLPYFRLMTDQPILSAHNVSLHFTNAAGRLPILQNVSLTVKRGETIGLLGPSGSGKSTLLMVLAGIEMPSEGEVVFHAPPAAQDAPTNGASSDEVTITALSESALARFRRHHIGIVFQSFHLIPTMTALENVALPLNFAGAPQAEKRAAALLGEVGLGARTGHYPSQLSGGEQQRVALARAVIARPPVILADEPTGNLDQRTGAEIMELLLSFPQAYGAAVILVTHDRKLAARCHRQLALSDGRLQTAAAPS